MERSRWLAPVWLSHHDAEEADRCMVVGRWHLCRRCTAMFAGFVPAVVLLVSSWRDDLQAGDVGLVLALCIVAAGEFVQVARGELAYSPRRVLVLAPFTGALLAWLGVTGIQDGPGPAHVTAGGIALALLVVLWRRGRAGSPAVSGGSRAGSPVAPS